MMIKPRASHRVSYTLGVCNYLLRVETTFLFSQSGVNSGTMHFNYFFFNDADCIQGSYMLSMGSNTELHS